MFLKLPPISLVHGGSIAYEDCFGKNSFATAVVDDMSFSVREERQRDVVVCCAVRLDSACVGLASARKLYL